MSTRPMVVTPESPMRADAEPGRRVRRDATAAVVRVAAVAFLVIGWIDVLLLWYPLNFGSPEWEFATTSGTFDGLPLATIGFAGLAALALARGSRGAAVALAVGGGLIALFVAASGVLFGLSWAQGLGMVSEPERWVLFRAGAKSGAFALIYVVVYGWLAYRLAGAARASRGTS